VKRRLGTINFFTDLKVIFDFAIFNQVVYFGCSLYLCIPYFFYHKPPNFGVEILLREENVIARIFKPQNNCPG